MESSVMRALCVIFLISICCPAGAEVTVMSFSYSAESKAACGIALQSIFQNPAVREAYFSRDESIEITLTPGNHTKPSAVIRHFVSNGCPVSQIKEYAFGKVVSENGSAKLRISGFADMILEIKSSSYPIPPPEIGAYLQADITVDDPEDADRGMVEQWQDTDSLVSAAWGDYYQVVERIQQGEDVNRIYPVSGRTPLIESRNVIITRALIKAGARLDAKNDSGQTALMKAASLGLTDVAKTLIASGAKLDLRDEDGCTALMIAAAEGQQDVARSLIRAGANVNVLNEAGISALEFAAWNGHAGIVEMLNCAGAKGGGKKIDLLLAIYQGDYQRVWELIRSGADAGFRDPLGTTTLMLAACDARMSYGYESLISGGADIHARNARGWTALGCAISRGDLEATRALVKAGADPNREGHYKETPLELAIQSGNPGIVKLLVEAGADIRRSEHRCRSPLEQAMQNRNDLIVDILKQAGAMVPSDAENSLIQAASKCQVDAVEALTKQKIDLDYRSSDWCRTALMYAAVAGCTEAVRILLAAGANPNATAPYGSVAGFVVEDDHAVTAMSMNRRDRFYSGGSWQSVLDLDDSKASPELVQLLENAGSQRCCRSNSLVADAVRNEDLDEIQNLLKSGADVNAKNTLGRTALQYASEKGSLPISTLLIEAGADVNGPQQKEDTNISPLVLATENGHFKIADLLLGHGADKTGFKKASFLGAVRKGDYPAFKALLNIGIPPDARTTSGDPAITLAVASGNVSIVRFLIQAGANLNALDSEDRTALEVAATNNRKDLVRLLLQSGADVNRPCRNHETPLSRIRDLESPAIVKMVEARAKR